MKSNLSVLLDMLTYCRPAGSDTEREFIEKYIAVLPGVIRDAYDNWHVWIGESPIIWSCHTDTVHSKPGRQTLHYRPVSGLVELSRKSRKSSWCLGADDTAGVFLCHQMILAGVPGHYVFHFGEEHGGFGSSDIRDRAPEVISDSLFAIALDRKGTADVITHQMGRCCSGVFAESLATQLNISGLDYTPSVHGVFTDTANYVDIIGECTNLSVGYEHAHTNAETLDTVHLDRLFVALCQLDQSALVSARKPGDEDSEDRGWLGLWRNEHDHAAPRGIWGHSTPYTEEECKYCGVYYCPEDSHATDNLSFCSVACEDAGSHTDSAYLDPIYDDV